MELLEELNQTIILLEASLPGNPERPVNRKLEKELQKQVEAYLKAVYEALPLADIERIYYKYGGV